MLGCKQHARRDDNRHNRLPGVCKFPLDVSTEWTCEACVQHKHSKDRKHTLKAGECQWASAPTRATASRKAQKTAPDGSELQKQVSVLTQMAIGLAVNLICMVVKSINTQQKKFCF